MKSIQPRTAAIIIGFVAMVITSTFLSGDSSLSTMIVILGAGYGASGLLVGMLWPNGAWKWGLWVVAPVLLLTGFSVLFAGDFGVFLRKDAPLLAIGLAAACLGALIGSRLSPRNRATDEDSTSEGGP